MRVGTIENGIQRASPRAAASPAEACAVNPEKATATRRSVRVIVSRNVVVGKRLHGRAALGARQGGLAPTGFSSEPARDKSAARLDVNVYALAAMVYFSTGPA